MIHRMGWWDWLPSWPFVTATASARARLVPLEPQMCQPAPARRRCDYKRGGELQSGALMSQILSAAPRRNGCGHKRGWQGTGWLLCGHNRIEHKLFSASPSNHQFLPWKRLEDVPRASASDTSLGLAALLPEPVILSAAKSRAERDKPCAAQPEKGEPTRRVDLRLFKKRTADGTDGHR